MMRSRALLALWGPLLALATFGAGCATPPPSASPAPKAAAAPPAELQSRALLNPGFESDKPGDTTHIEGWYMYQHAGEQSYAFVLDTDVKHGGTRSMRIDNIGSQPYGSIAQLLPGEPFAQKTVRFSAWLKTRDVTEEGASIFVIAERGGAINAYDLMPGKEIKGTRDWQRYSITLAIPQYTDRLRVGATLQGPGSVWFDDAELEIVTPR